MFEHISEMFDRWLTPKYLLSLRRIDSHGQEHMSGVERNWRYKRLSKQSTKNWSKILKFFC